MLINSVASRYRLLTRLPAYLTRLPPVTYYVPDSETYLLPTGRYEMYLLRADAMEMPSKLLLTWLRLAQHIPPTSLQHYYQHKIKFMHLNTFFAWIQRVSATCAIQTQLHNNILFPPCPSETTKPLNISLHPNLALYCHMKAAQLNFLTRVARQSS